MLHIIVIVSPVFIVILASDWLQSILINLENYIHHNYDDLVCFGVNKVISLRIIKTEKLFRRLITSPRCQVLMVFDKTLPKPQFKWLCFICGLIYAAAICGSKSIASVNLSSKASTPLYVYISMYLYVSILPRICRKNQSAPKLPHFATLCSKASGWPEAVWYNSSKVKLILVSHFQRHPTPNTCASTN